DLIVTGVQTCALPILSGEITEEFAMRATRVAAFAAVAVALLGLAEIVVQTHAAAALGPGGDGTPRITATFGSPVVLAAYLVLGKIGRASCRESGVGRG